ncbi:MAG: hypothetical protein AAGH82_04960, partial [Pseudomonadota bacterium]
GFVQTISGFHLLGHKGHFIRVWAISNNADHCIQLRLVCVSLAEQMLNTRGARLYHLTHGHFNAWCSHQFVNHSIVTGRWPTDGSHARLYVKTKQLRL